MNQIARQLKEKNIAEYLIYMWQEEDLIRANHGELEEIEKANPTIMANKMVPPNPLPERLTFA